MIMNEIDIIKLHDIYYFNEAGYHVELIEIKKMMKGRCAQIKGNSKIISIVHTMDTLYNISNDHIDGKHDNGITIQNEISKDLAIRYLFEKVADLERTVFELQMPRTFRQVH